MTEWWTYRIADFLMFSPATYWRQVELHNTRFWPGPVVAWAAGLALVWLLTRGSARTERVALALLALAWAWVGSAFFAARMAQIHLAAPGLAVACAVHAVLLGAVALWPSSVAPRAATRWTRGWLLVAGAAALAYPVVGTLAGRPWTQAEVFGWMPDPTAWVTLASVIALRHVPRWQQALLAVLPVAFIVAGWVNHASMAQ